MLIRSTAIVLLLLLFWSCEEVVDLDVDFDPAIVVVSEVAPGREVKVSLSRVRPILSQEPAEYVFASEVTIINRRTDELTELFLFEPEKDTIGSNSNLFPFYFSTDTIITRSTSYELNIRVDGEAPISATTTIPQSVSIESLNLTDFSVDSDPREEDKFNIDLDLDFNHNPNISKSYHLVFYFLYQEQQIGVETDTTAINFIQVPRIDNFTTDFPYTFDFENGILIRGEDMSAGSHRMEAKLSVNFDEVLSPSPPELFVELRNTNADYQSYHFNLSRQLSQRDSLLPQAILIPTNINNGLGVFSGYNLDSQLVPLTN